MNRNATALYSIPSTTSNSTKTTKKKNSNETLYRLYYVYTIAHLLLRFDWFVVGGVVVLSVRRVCLLLLARALLSSFICSFFSRPWILYISSNNFHGTQNHSVRLVFGIIFLLSRMLDVNRNFTYAETTQCEKSFSFEQLGMQFNTVWRSLVPWTHPVVPLIYIHEYTALRSVPYFIFQSQCVFRVTMVSLVTAIIVTVRHGPT